MIHRATPPSTPLVRRTPVTPTRPLTPSGRLEAPRAAAPKRPAAAPAPAIPAWMVKAEALIQGTLAAASRVRMILANNGAS